MGIDTTADTSSNGTATSLPFTPTEIGNWSVDAIFTDGNNDFKTKSVSFNVTEAALPSITPAAVGQETIEEPAASADINVCDYSSDFVIASNTTSSTTGNFCNKTRD
jgi:hypothetical protein